MEQIEIDVAAEDIDITPKVIPTGWEWVRLNDVALMGSGHTPDKKEPSYYNGGIKWVSLQDSHRLDTLNLTETTIEISAEGIRKSSAVLHPANTVILCRDAGVGRSAIIREQMAVSQHFIAWRCGPRIDAEFLYYSLQQLKPFFEQQATGSTIKTLGLPFFKKLHLLLPPLSEQKQIVSVLKGLDECAETTKSLLQAKRQYKSGLMQQLLTGQRRFPEFEGQPWREMKLRDLFDQVRRPYREGVEAILSISAKIGFVSQQARFSRAASGATLSRYTLLHKGEFSYNKGNSDLYPRGCVYMLDGYEEAAVPNVYISFRNKGEVSSEFYRHYFLNRMLDDQLASKINAGVRNDGLLNLNTDDFFDVLVRVPPYEEQQRIAAVLTAMNQEMELLKAQLHQWQEQRKGLMQKLLTGEVRVK